MGCCFSERLRLFWCMDQANHVRRRVVVCAECGQTFTAKRNDAEMCSARCRTARRPLCRATRRTGEALRTPGGPIRWSSQGINQSRRLAQVGLAQRSAMASRPPASNGGLHRRHGDAVDVDACRAACRPPARLEPAPSARYSLVKWKNCGDPGRRPNINRVRRRGAFGPAEAEKVRGECG